MGAVTCSGTHHVLIENYLVQTAHGNGDDPNGNKRRTRRLKDPFPAVCGNRGDFSLTEVALRPMQLGQQGGATMRPASEPVPTVATRGIIRLFQPYLVKYYGTGTSARVSDTLDTVTCKERFALVEAHGKAVGSKKRKKVKPPEGKPHLEMPIVEIDGVLYEVWLRWRMLQPHELALAQGFRRDYRFIGNKTVVTKQIGNAVPRFTARSLFLSVLTQDPDVAWSFDEDRCEAAA
jgi:DNA (cytosine-5)-methyltransferase 1